MESVLFLFKALSDKNRLRVVYALSHYQELCACQITELLGIKGATTSRHLAVLQGAGVVKSRKVGRWVYFSLSNGLPFKDAIIRKLEKDPLLIEDLKNLDVIFSTDAEVLCRRQRGKECCPEITKERELR